MATFLIEQDTENYLIKRGAKKKVKYGKICFKGLIWQGEDLLLTEFIESKSKSSDLHPSQDTIILITSFK